MESKKSQPTGKNAFVKTPMSNNKKVALICGIIFGVLIMAMIIAIPVMSRSARKDNQPLSCTFLNAPLGGNYSSEDQLEFHFSDGIVSTVDLVSIMQANPRSLLAPISSEELYNIMRSDIADRGLDKISVRMDSDNVVVEALNIEIAEFHNYPGVNFSWNISSVALRDPSITRAELLEMADRQSALTCE